MTPPRRVLLVITSSDFGGAETLAAQLARGLSPSRFRVKVCSVKPKGRLALALEQADVEVVSLEAELRSAWRAPWRLLQAFRRLRRLIRDFRPEIIHTSLFQADVLGVLAGAAERVPVRVTTVHMVLRRKWFQLVLERALAPWVDRFIPVSEDLRRFYRRRLALPEDKMEVIYNGVDPDSVLNRSREPLSAMASNKEGPPRLCALGRLDPQKRWQDLLKAAALLKGRGVPFEVFLVGDGPESLRLRNLAAEWGVSDRIHFAGYQSNPMPFLAGSSALVLCSGEEGLPLVVLEAMALAVPVIATSVGAVPEAVEDGRTGYLVPVARPAALAEAIQRLLQDPPGARALGRRGQERLRQRFTVQEHGRRMQALYERLLNVKISPS